MAMTGKQHDTQESVGISEELEEQFLRRMVSWNYDSEKDLEFYSCSDGIVIKVPVVLDPSDPESVPVLIFNFMTQHFDEGTPLADLGPIYASGTALGTPRREKAKELGLAAISG
jgi:hypothetical protein